MSITDNDVRARLAPLIENDSVVLWDEHWHAEGEACGTNPATFRSCSRAGTAVADLARLFRHATAFTYTALVAEDAVLRNEDGTPSTDPKMVGRTKGFKKYLDEWKAKGLIS